MNVYKSFERPSQILGIDIQNLFLVIGFLIVSGLLTGLYAMFASVHWSFYLIILLITIGLFSTFKYLAKHHPPGYAIGFLSFHLRQPKRISVGSPRPSQHVRVHKK